MTWIVGMPTMRGYSFGISDIRVTLADGSERDCLQKIYPVAQSIALGFAGSVCIGFKMVEVIMEWLHTDAPDHAWISLETIRDVLMLDTCRTAVGVTYDRTCAISQRTAVVGINLRK